MAWGNMDRERASMRYSALVRRRAFRGDLLTEMTLRFCRTAVPTAPGLRGSEGGEKRGDRSAVYGSEAGGVQVLLF